jgi:dihydroneopterin aldolase
VGENAVSAPDVIELRGIRLLGIHGVLAEERSRAQPFEVDVDLETDLSEPGIRDALTSTVDYAEALRVVQVALGPPSAQLLEHLAARMASSLLEAFPTVSAVVVALRKVRPPVPVDAASAGVRIRRQRG